MTTAGRLPFKGIIHAVGPRLVTGTRKTDLSKRSRTPSSALTRRAGNLLHSQPSVPASTPTARHLRPSLPPCRAGVLHPIPAITSQDHPARPLQGLVGRTHAPGALPPVGSTRQGLPIPLGDIRAQRGIGNAVFSGMFESNDFALVPRPPGVLEKAEPGAKRILSGMVADTLALAKKEQTSKTVFSVATCGGPLTTEGLQILVSSLLQKILGDSYVMELSAFEFADDLLGTTGHFDLVFVLRWPFSPLISLSKGAPEPHKLVAELRTKFGKPVIVIGLESWCRDMEDVDRGWQESGADAYFEVDFSVKSFVVPEDLNRALGTCVAKSQITDQSLAKSVAKAGRTSPVRIVILDDEPLIQDIYRMLLENRDKGVVVVDCYDGDKAWEELSRADPDLLIMDWVTLE